MNVEENISVFELNIKGYAAVSVIYSYKCLERVILYCLKAQYAMYIRYLLLALYQVMPGVCS